MGLSDVLEIGKQGLSAHQEAVSTASNNIANVNTPGHSRQRVELAARGLIQKPPRITGGGVKVAQIVRVHDRFVTKKIYDETKFLGTYKTKNELFQQLESLMTNHGATVRDRLSEFFNDFRALSVNPEIETLKFAVKESGKNLTQAFQSMDNALEELQHDLHVRLTDNISEVNAMAKELAHINEKIVEIRGIGAEPATLLDQRDGILNRLSQKLGFDKIVNERGQVNIILPGMGNLVNGDQASQFEALRAPERDGEKRPVDLFHSGADLPTRYGKLFNRPLESRQLIRNALRATGF